MKLMHLSDLHLGKTLSGYSLREDQRYILDRILEITEEQKPDCILIAGDVFDRSAPSAETVTLLDDFLTGLAAYHIPILMIAGNHDSPERIAYGGRIMQSSGIYLSPVYDGTIRSVTLSDAYGEVCFWLMPFLHTEDVRTHFKDTKIPDANAAMQTVIGSMQLDPSVRNVLIAHQFVGGASLSDSEEMYCGTAEQVSREVFAPFVYTALGHLHRPQNVGSVRIRYCGTPLKYSAAEADMAKSVTFVELGDRDSEPVITTVPLVPMRDMQKLRGSFQELMEGTNDNYVHIVLTDETDIPENTHILNKQSKQSIMDSFDTFMDLMNKMIWLLVIAAVVLGIVVLFNLGIMSYTERYREMATLKVVGFKDSRIGRLLISQNMWLTVIGIALGIPAGIGVLQYLLTALASEYELKLVLGPATWIGSILLTFGVSLAVGLMISRKNRKIDMVAALKTEE